MVNHTARPPVKSDQAEMPAAFEFTYLLPFRRALFDKVEAATLNRYLEMIEEARCEVILIDGSPPEVFARNRSELSASCRHEPVDRRYGYLNDKVNGVHTGVALASFEKIILADDDIRYKTEQIAQILQLLDALRNREAAEFSVAAAVVGEIGSSANADQSRHPADGGLSGHLRLPTTRAFLARRSLRR